MCTTRFAPNVQKALKTALGVLGILSALCAKGDTAPIGPQEVSVMSERVFPISYWVSPPSVQERYDEAAECRFNVVPGPPEALDLAQKAGIKLILQDRRIHAHMTETPGWEASVQAVVDAYATHPALWGYYVTDEPSYHQFDALARIVRAFEARDPQHPTFINLFPNYASPEQLGTLDYTEHVRRYVDLVQPRLVSYDYYTLLEDGEREGYFENMAIIRGEARRVGVPFWNIILSTPHYCYRDPSPVDLRWQVYTTLAYGGKGICYFTYWTHESENFGNAILGLYGDRTSKYAVVQQLNTEIGLLGPHLLRLDSVRVEHWPAGPQGAQAFTGEGLVARVEGEGDIVIGEFVDRDGLPWLMLANNDKTRSPHLTLHLRTEQREVLEVSRRTGELRPITPDERGEVTPGYADGIILHLWLAPGDGRLFRLGQAS